MPPEELAAILDRRPFEPFRVFLSDGTVYEARHPELVLLGKRSAVIGITQGDNGTRPLYERNTTFSLLHVVRLEPFEAARA
jgi:hypothetical protein